jgi:hypothetical protein
MDNYCVTAEESHGSQVPSPDWYMHRDFTREQFLHARPYDARVLDADEDADFIVEPGAGQENRNSARNDDRDVHERRESSIDVWGSARYLKLFPAALETVANPGSCYRAIQTGIYLAIGGTPSEISLPSTSTGS